MERKDYGRDREDLNGTAAEAARRVTVGTINTRRHKSSWRGLRRRQRRITAGVLQDRTGTDKWHQERRLGRCKNRLNFDSERFIPPIRKSASMAWKRS
jgi:hypothetical protein